MKLLCFYILLNYLQIQSYSVDQITHTFPPTDTVIQLGEFHTDFGCNILVGVSNTVEV